MQLDVKTSFRLLISRSRVEVSQARLPTSFAVLLRQRFGGDDLIKSNCCAGMAAHTCKIGHAHKCARHTPISVIWLHVVMPLRVIIIISTAACIPELLSNEQFHQ